MAGLALEPRHLALKCVRETSLPCWRICGRSFPEVIAELSFPTGLYPPRRGPLLKTTAGRSRSHTVVTVAESMNSCSVLRCCRGKRDFNEKDSFLREGGNQSQAEPWGRAGSGHSLSTHKQTWDDWTTSSRPLPECQCYEVFWARPAGKGPLFPDGSGDLS